MAGIKMLGCSLFLFMVAPLIAQTDSWVAAEGQNGELQARLDLGILQNETVQKHLNSGLTTTFLLECRLGVGQKDEETRVLGIAIRYELWEEVFFVKVFNDERTLISEKLAQWKGLSEWWNGARLNLGAGTVKNQAFRLVIEVFPFSAQEREAAAAWVSQSLGEGATLGSAEANDIGARILSTIVATSFKRRVLQTFSYKGKLGDVTSSSQ